MYSTLHLLTSLTLAKQGSPSSQIKERKLKEAVEATESNMRDFTITKVHYTENERDAKSGQLKSYITSEKAFNKALKDATEKSEPLPELISSQTFGFKNAETVDEAVGLAGGNGVGEYENIDVFLGVFNYAADLRQHNAANDLLQSDAFQPRDGVWDISTAVAEKVERVKMSPEEKAAKTLGVTPDQLRAALALILQQGASATA